MKKIGEVIDVTYGQNELSRKLLQSMIAAGIDMQQLTTADLLAFDELHVMGRQATVALGRRAALTAGMQVLDIGSGLGGPARTLAENFGCRVIGVDLASSYVEAAMELTERVGLSATVSFQYADALNLPFREGEFDTVVLIHVTMNIAEKAALFREIRRVLKPGGRLALWELCQGEGAALIYPVPWANDAAFSYLVSITEMIAALEQAGFESIQQTDATDEAVQWVTQRVRAAEQKTGNRPSPDLDLVLPEFRLKRANISKNLMQGAIRVLRVVAMVS